MNLRKSLTKCLAKQNRSIIALSIGIFFILVSPWIFTRPAWLSFLDFSNTGQIGDTIGGITAPLMGLIASYLIYLSFKAQTDMNEKQFAAIDAQFKRMRDEDEEGKYNRMQHVINVINQNYLGQFVDLVGHNGILFSSLKMAGDKSLGRVEKELESVLTLLPRLNILLHIKHLIVSDKAPNKEKLSFIKIQVKMIFETLNFQNNYYKSQLDLMGIDITNSEVSQQIISISEYIANLKDLYNMCEEKSIYGPEN